MCPIEQSFSNCTGSLRVVWSTVLFTSNTFLVSRANQCNRSMRCDGDLGMETKMTRLTTILLVLCAGCTTPPARANTLTARAAAVAVVRSVTLSWSFPQSLETPDLIFKLYHSTDLAVPLAQWPLYLTVPGTNRSVAVPAVEAKEFFTLTVSNYLGESGFATQ